MKNTSKNSRDVFTGPQTYGMDTGIPVSVANRLAALEKKLKRRKK